MQPVPVDLILHAFAENLIGMEGNNESLRSLGHTILRTCIDMRALPAQWRNGAGVGQQMSWLTRRIVDGDTHPHVAAETRAMEVAISRRLADTAFSLLITQDDGDKTASLTLLEAAHRVVGLPSAEVQSEDTTSWQSRVLALEGQLKAAVDLKDAWALEANSRTHLAENLNTELKDAAVSLLHMHKERDALQVKLTEAIANAAAHFEDVKTARDEADSLRVKLRQEESKVLDLEADVERLAESDKRADLYRDHMQEVRAALGILTIAPHSETIKRIGDIRNVDSSRRQHVADLKDEVAMLRRDHAALGNVEAATSQRAEDYRQRLLAINEALGIACNASQELTIKTIGELRQKSYSEIESLKSTRDKLLHDLDSAKANLAARNTIIKNFTDQWETWARNLLGAEDGTAQELKDFIGKKVKRAEVLSQQNLVHHDIIETIIAALKLDPGASKSDIIETIKSLHADRAKLCVLICGDNDKTVEAPRFKVGDRVIYGEYSSAIVWTVEQVQEDGKMCHLKREFHPAMVAACTSIHSVPVASLTLTA